MKGDDASRLLNMLRYASALLSTVPACKHFQLVLGHNLPEATACRFQDVYRTQLLNRKRQAGIDVDEPINELVPRKRG